MSLDTATVHAFITFARISSRLRIDYPLFALACRLSICLTFCRHRISFSPNCSSMSLDTDTVHAFITFARIFYQLHIDYSLSARACRLSIRPTPYPFFYTNCSSMSLEHSWSLRGYTATVHAFITFARIFYRLRINNPLSARAPKS